MRNRETVDGLHPAWRAISLTPMLPPIFSTIRQILCPVTHATSSPSLPKVGYTRDEAAKMLGISVESLTRLAARGLIKPSRALRRLIYSVEEMERFMKDTCINT